MRRQCGVSHEVSKLLRPLLQEWGEEPALLGWNALGNASGKQPRGRRQQALQAPKQSRAPERVSAPAPVPRCLPASPTFLPSVNRLPQGLAIGFQ